MRRAAAGGTVRRDAAGPHHGAQVRVFGACGPPIREGFRDIGDRASAVVQVKGRFTYRL